MKPVLAASVARIAVAALAIAFMLPARAPEVSPVLGRLHADLVFLTSEALAGRVSLTPQADIAAQYVSAEFERSGLAPVASGSYLQKFPLVGYRPDPACRHLELIKLGGRYEFQAGVDYTAAFYRDISIRGPIAFAGYGITAPEYGYDDYAGLDASGKVVLIFDHEPQENDPKSIFNGTGHTLHAGRWMKLNNARQHGAMAVLIASDGIHHSTGQMLPSAQTNRPGGAQTVRGYAPPQALDDPGQIPGFSITEAAASQFLAPAGKTAPELERLIDANLKPQSTAIGGETVELGACNSEQHRATSLNAVGLLEGSDPALKAETVIFTAHYDHLGMMNGHMYPGANDNASGAAGVMELARLFAQSSERPKRGILFIVFGSEEEQMLGSFYYTSHPLRPLDTTRAVINLDMIGRDEAHIAQDEGGLPIPSDTGNLLNLVGDFYSPDLREILQRANRPIGLTLDTKYDRDHTLSALFRCDHLPFLIAHIPAVWLFGGFHPGYHEPVDTVDRLNMPKLMKVVRLAFASGMEVANAAAPPRFR